VGVRALLEELLAALDCTAERKKLTGAALGAVVLGALLALARYPLREDLGRAWSLGAAALALFVVALVGGLLARLTYFELANLRPARWRDGLRGLPGLAVRLAVVQGGALVILVGLIVLLRRLPSWLPEGGDGSPWDAIEPAAVQALFGISLILEAALWPLCALVLPLGPLLAVERCGALTALREWLALVRRHFARLLLCEGLALGIGLVVSVPFCLPVLVLFTRQPEPHLAETATVARDVLSGLALTPLLAYLIVANVFIYLALRYEWGGRG
jgi:hypothetical protein